MKFESFNFHVIMICVSLFITFVSILYIALTLIVRLDAVQDNLQVVNNIVCSQPGQMNSEFCIKINSHKEQK